MCDIGRFLPNEPYQSRFSRRAVLFMLRKQLMLSRIAISLALVAAFFVASEGPASSACIFVNASIQKACASACGANKCCCQTSQNRTGSRTQPLATTSSHQKNFIALTAFVPKGTVNQLHASERSGFSIAEHSWHSPPTLALLCIRLI